MINKGLFSSQTDNWATPQAEETGFYEYEYPSQGKLQFVRAGEEEVSE